MYILAVRLHRSGRAEEALPLYAKAVELLPHNPYVAFNYGTLLQDRGDVKRAVALLERAVAVGGSTEIAGDARARLAELRGKLGGAPLSLARTR